MTDPVSYAVEINAWTGASVQTLRIATHSFGTLPSDIPANVTYIGCISDIGAIEQSVFSGNGVLGSPRISEGYIEVANAGRLDSWLNYGFDGRTFVVYRLGVFNLYSSRQRMFTGTLIGLDASNAWTNLRLRIRDRLQELDRPLLTVRYAGTTLSTGQGIEGNEELKDQIKPVIFGFARNVTPKAVNPFDLLYQVCFNPVTSITVKVGGSVITSAGDVGTIEALMAAVVPGTGYVTCLAQGVFKMGFSPAAVLTADVVQSSSTAAQAALAILQYYGITDFNLDSFASADLFNDALVGIYLDTDESVLNVVSRVLDSIGCAVIPNVDGEFSAVIMQDPASLTPVAEFDVNDIRDGTSLTLLAGASEEGEGVPIYSVVLKFNKNYTPMDLGQLAGILPDVEKVILMEEGNTANAKDETILTAHPLATEITKETLLFNSADATAEATRLLNMYKTRRDRIMVTLHDVDADGIELGDCVLLTLDRFGFDVGKKFIVLGRTDEFRNRSVLLNLWG